MRTHPLPPPGLACIMQDLKLLSFSIHWFRVLDASFSSFGCFVFEFWVLRVRVLGASFSSFGNHCPIYSLRPNSTAEQHTRITFTLLHSCQRNPVISFQGQILPSQIVPQSSQFVPHILYPFSKHSLRCRRILGGRNHVRVRIVVAAIFHFMAVEDWEE